MLRFRAQLDYLIELHARRQPQRLDPEVLAALRMGIYQLRYLDRIPSHAAVGESVELVKRARKRSAAGFVNAVLRRVDRAAVEWPDRATRLSHPEWLLERWSRQFGGEAAEAIARADLQKPETYIRVPAGFDPPPSAEPAGPEGCYRYDGPPGAFRIQDIGSQSIVPLLRLEPGLTFLDVCAAPGNKTAQALEYGVSAIACDARVNRLGMLRALSIPLAAANALEPLPFSRKFDRILLDAPCSGTGTLARNPEIKWKLQPSDIADLERRQATMLSHALEALAPGGILVYSTCSIEAEENEQVVARVLAGRACWTMRRTPGRDPGDGFFAAVIEFPLAP